MSEFTNCETCQGWGWIRKEDGSLTCPTCQGEAVTSHYQDYSLVAWLPDHFPKGDVQKSQWRDRLRPWLLALAVTITLITGWRLATSTPVTAIKLTDAFYQTETATSYAGLKGITSQTSLLNLLFWLLIVLDIYLIFLRYHEQESPHYLRDLRETDPNKRLHVHLEKDGSLDIVPYFSQAARQAIEQAVIMAERSKTTVVSPQIFLASLLCSGKTAVIISRLEKDPLATCRRVLEKITPPQEPPTGSVVLAPETRQLIINAFIEAYESGFELVDVEDYLLVAAKYPGPLQDELNELELSYDQLRSVAFWLNEEMESIRKWQFWRERGRTRPKGYMNRAWTARPTPFLDQYSRDFTQLASLGKLPIVKVRKQEIEAAIRILAAGEKNNALIVGEPGVGKTSIVGAIAERMVEETVPEPLKDKRLIELNLSALVSGGESEKANMDRLLQEALGAGNVILFIGHVEALVDQKGGISAAALLEAASKTSQLQIIGTATHTDYHRYIESNPAFANSFQKVEINEVNDNDAITIIEEESPLIQNEYRVLLTYPAIKAAVTLSRRLIPDQVLPEKALLVLQDASQLANTKKRRVVTKDLVLEVLTNRTGVPVQEITEDERSKLVRLSEEMKKRVIGQEEAVEKISEALRRARTGLKDEKRPIGSFLFVGPTGVGKTETARTLAGTYFGNRDAMMRLDMSEYQDAKAIYRLIGAPATSASEFTEGGALTRAVREKPYSIILLDEIEKAHPDVMNLFLQLLDDGRLTENTGRTVSFANTIVIATSNAGASEIANAVSANSDHETLNLITQKALSEHFRPEFINRFDAVITFKPLTSENVQTIAAIMLNEVAAKLKEQGIEAVFGNDVIAYVSQAGFDPKFGARPLRRAIQDHVETRLADLLLAGQINKKEKLVITAPLLGLTTGSTS